MAKKSGLGKGLDSLIPDYYNEDFDSNSTVSLEDLLDETTEEEIVEEEIIKESEKVKKETPKPVKKDEIKEKVSESINEGKKLTDKEIDNIEEVKEIVAKNPRITLWSSRSACVFRYLRKTEPEFSISKEASILIDEAVSKKYPEIWEMFKEI